MLVGVDLRRGNDPSSQLDRTQPSFLAPSASVFRGVVASVVSDWLSSDRTLGDVDVPI